MYIYIYKTYKHLLAIQISGRLPSHPPRHQPQQSPQAVFLAFSAAILSTVRPSRLSKPSIPAVFSSALLLSQPSPQPAPAISPADHPSCFSQPSPQLSL